MPEPKKHNCKILVCPDCGKKYRAEKMELLAFVPFNVERKGRRGSADDAAAVEQD